MDLLTQLNVLYNDVLKAAAAATVSSEDKDRIAKLTVAVQKANASYAVDEVAVNEAINEAATLRMQLQAKASGSSDKWLIAGAIVVGYLFLRHKE